MLSVRWSCNLHRVWHSDEETKLHVSQGLEKRHDFVCLHSCGRYRHNTRHIQHAKSREDPTAHVGFRVAGLHAMIFP